MCFSRSKDDLNNYNISRQSQPKINRTALINYSKTKGISVFKNSQNSGIFIKSLLIKSDVSSTSYCPSEIKHERNSINSQKETAILFNNFLNSFNLILLSIPMIPAIRFFLKFGPWDSPLPLNQMSQGNNLYKAVVSDRYFFLFL